jgi:two-component system, LytTR family, response regulator
MKKTSVKVAIVEDERDGREYLGLLIKNEFPDLEITSVSDSVESAKKNLAASPPDILLLDVELGDGNAFDLLNNIMLINTKIIFITAYRDYAIKAIKNNAVDYILKPVKREEFLQAMTKAVSISEKSQRQVLQTPSEEKIRLKTSSEIINLEISRIIRCEADSNYTIFYLTDHSKLVISRTLQEFERLLSGNGFLRIHHKHLINPMHLKQYIKGQGGEVIMSDNSAVKVSIRRKSKLLSILNIQHPNI